MAPFRASRSTRSGRPGGPSDHDIFDGLPVRQWKMHESPFGPGEDVHSDAAKSAATQNGGRPELPMPKGSDQYPPWSLQLLRAARSGKVLKSQVGATSSHDPDNENNVEETRVDELQRGTKRGPQNGFVATKWTQVPKHLEGPEREYVAKRRKGLQSTYYAANGISSTSVDGAHMRKTKVQRPDEEGLPQVLEVMVPEGKTVEGEIKNESAPDVIAAPIANPAPGTVVEGLGVANENGVVIATEGIVPLKKRHGPVGRKKKNRGTKKISSTEGMGVSASAEAFQEQLRAQRLAEGGASGDANGQGDQAMSGVGDGDEDDDEEGSGDDEEDGDGEGDTMHESAQELQKPADNGDTSMVLDDTSGPLFNSVEADALKQPEDEEQTQPQDNVPTSAKEESPEQLLEGPYELIEHEVPDQADEEPKEHPTKESPDVEPAEPPAVVKEEAVEAVTVKEEVPEEQPPLDAEPLQEDAPAATIEDTDPEPQSHAPPPPEPSQQTEPTPPEDLGPPEQEAETEAPVAEKIESIEQAPPPQPTTEEPNDDSSDVPTRPSPEPLSPYSLSPISKAHMSPSPLPPPPRSEPSAAATVASAGRDVSPSKGISGTAAEDVTRAHAEAAERKDSGASAASQAALPSDAENVDDLHAAAGASLTPVETGAVGVEEGGGGDDAAPPQVQATGGDVNGSAE